MSDQSTLFWKVIIAICIIGLTIVMSAYSVEAAQYYFNEPNTLLDIEQCEGPIKVRLSSYYRLQDNEISLVDCIRLSNYVYNCDCSKGSTTLEFQVSSNYSNAYNFDILYYLDYWHIEPRVFDENTTWEERNPTEEEIELDNNLRQVQIKGIMLREPKKVWNIELNMTLGSIVLACIVIVIGGAMFAFRHFKRKLDNDYEVDQGTDMFNYSTKELDKSFDKMIESADKNQKKGGL